MKGRGCGPRYLSRHLSGGTEENQCSVAPLNKLRNKLLPLILEALTQETACSAPFVTDQYSIKIFINILLIV
jgi:hypothetical protein